MDMKTVHTCAALVIAAATVAGCSKTERTTVVERPATERTVVVQPDTSDKTIVVVPENR